MFNTHNIEIPVRYCQTFFGFDLPSALLAKRWEIYWDIVTCLCFVNFIKESFAFCND